VVAVVAAVAALSAPAAQAAAICSSPPRILAQPRPALDVVDKYKDEFKALSGSTYDMEYLNENDRRAKSRADASIAGSYNVYYIDEANVALFAKSGWVVPILDYYPKEYDFNDFDPSMRTVATVDGKPWFAPTDGGTDVFVYRKDLLAAAGLKVPTTLDELVADAKKLNDPANNVYGIALRGTRGSGANVWRWMPYFRGFGGEWFKDGKPAFNSEAAVKATELYVDLFKYAPPGMRAGNWDEATNAFLAGNVALLVESSPLVGMTLDPKVSQVMGKVGFAPPPSPLTGGGYGHGFAIGSKANPDEASKKCAALFIAWATSKQMELRRIEENVFQLTRTSAFNSPEFAAKYGADIGPALTAAGKVTAINFWQDPRWPELGDRWGIILEELITGSRTDIKQGLDELETYANQLLKK